MQIATKVVFRAASVTSSAATATLMDCAVAESRNFSLKSCLRKEGVTPRDLKQVSLTDSALESGNRNTIYETRNPVKVPYSKFQGKDWRSQSLQSLARARVVAIQLADGLGLVYDPVAVEEGKQDSYWEGASLSVNEDRRLPMVWLGDSVLKYSEPDREEAWFSIPFPVLPVRVMSRKTALGLRTVDDFLHMGDTPKDGEIGTRIQEVPVRECTAKVISRVSATSQLGRSAVAKKSKARRSNVKLWLVDSGCGHDLLSRKEVADAELDQSPCEPARFNTAGGPTTATTVAPLYIEELRGNIQPYVLSSTPAVVSMGRRCGHEGYSFVWMDGKCPYFITPDKQRMRLRVIGDIPYIIPGDPFCQPMALDDMTVEERESMPAPVGDIDPPHPSIKDDAGKENLQFALPNAEGDPEVAQGDGGEPPGPEPVGGVDDLPQPEGEGPPHIVVGNDAGDVGQELPPPEPEGDDEVAERRRRNLRIEARSLTHLLTHLPKNPYCDACTRGKMRNKKRKSV